MPTAKEILEILHLEPLPGEGGYFKETYRSALSPPSTAIYYLLTADDISALHRLPGDEIYHHYLGDPVEMLLLRPDGNGDVVEIGTDIAGGMRPQVVVPGGTWQGSRLVAGGELALMGTTMTPGFELADYEAADRDRLIREYPRFSKLITALTKT